MAAPKLTIVVPGDGTLDAEARALAEALPGTRAEVLGARTPQRLAEVFAQVERRTRREDVGRVIELLSNTRIIGTVLNRSSESERRAY